MIVGAGINKKIVAYFQRTRYMGEVFQVMISLSNMNSHNTRAIEPISSQYHARRCCVDSLDSHRGEKA